MNLACIGCGFIAGIHAASIGRIDGARLVHACDLREHAAAAFAARFAVPAWSSDPAAVLADPGVDGVLICTHPESHAELAIAAARAGKHLFVEKPLATTSQGCRAIIAAAASAGVTLAVDLKFRHAEAIRAVQAAVPEPVLIVAQTAMDPLPDDSPHMDPAAGGGVLENLGAHLFDLVCALAGAAPARVFAEGRRLPGRSRTLVDAVAGTLTFPSGCVASFVVADTGEWPHASKWFYEVSNVDARAVISEHCRRAVIASATGSETVEALDVPPHEVGARAALADFVEAARHGRQPLASGADGLRSVVVVEAVHRALRDGVVVPIGPIDEAP
jgi:predicted dehydrogenase